MRSSEKGYVLCVDSPGWGGSERDLLRLFPVLKNKVTALVFGKVVASQLLRQFAKKDIEIVRTASSNALFSMPLGLLKALDLIWRFRSCKFIVWAHHCESSRWLQFALALTLRDYLIVERLMPGSVTEAKNSRSRALLKSYIGRNARQVVLCGFSQVENYKNWFKVPTARIFVVPNSRPIQNIHDRAKILRKDRNGLRDILHMPSGIVLLSIGRLVIAQKSQDTLVMAIGKLREKGLLVSLVLVGSGPDLEQLANLAERCAPGAVTFVGETPDPISYLAAVNIFVLPSLSEGLPGVLLEAMAAQLPCVASDIPGNRELIKDQLTGLLIPPSDVNALVGAIESLMHNNELAERLAVNAHKYVLESYDEKIEIEAWSKVL
jgi:glycosyltransferase involved in cell wall biosynthesis